MFDLLAAVMDGHGQQAGPFAGFGVLPESGDAGVLGAGIDRQSGLVDFLWGNGLVDQLEAEEVPADEGFGPALFDELAGPGRMAGGQGLLVGVDDGYVGDLVHGLVLGMPELSGILLSFVGGGGPLAGVR